MWRLYPILRGLTRIVFVAFGVGLLTRYAFAWLTNDPSSAHWQLIIDHWPWVVAPTTALLALTTWAYFADKKHRAREGAKTAEIKLGDEVSQSVENSSDVAQANVGGNENVVVQATGKGPVTVNVNKPAAPKLPVPMQIAPPPEDFTGREEELKELVDAVKKGGTTIFGLRGMGGIGKTAMAQKIARMLKRHFPDGQIYLDLKGAKHDEEEVGQIVEPLTASEALGRIIASYGPEVNVNATVDERAARYRSILAGKRVLILMDNARDEKQVMPLLPPEGPVLIVTSRQKLTLPGLFPKDLHTLPPDRACELLLRIAPRIGDAAAQLAGLCGYLPLAMRAAASAIQNRKDLSLPEFLRKMQDAQGRMRETGVELAFRTSSELLEPALRDLWFQLSVFPGTFEPAGAAAVWQIDSDAAKERLSRLLAYNLVEWDSATSRYRLHDLARDFTTLQLDETTRIAAQGRHAEHYKNVLAAADQKYLSGGALLSEGLALFDLEWSNIQAGQAWAAAHRERDPSVLQLCEAYTDTGANVLSLRQPPREQIKWLEAALDSARKLEDRSQEGNALGNLGIAYKSLGEYRRAIEFYKQHLAIARERRDRRGEGSTLGNLGVAYFRLGEYCRAIEFHEQRLTIARELRDRRGECAALGNLGNAYHALGEYRRAIEFHEQTLAISSELGDRHGEGKGLGNLGNAYYRLSEYRRAIEYYEQDLAIAREIGDRQGEGNALGNLGSAYYALGEYRRAIKFHEQQLAITREIGDRQGEGDALWNAAIALDELGNRAEAIHRAEQALSIFEQIGSPAAEIVRAILATWQN